MNFKDFEIGDNLYKVPVDLCEPNNWNPNEMDDALFNRLTKEIEETGMINPIHVVPLDDGKFRIIGGQHRWQVAKILGHKTIECKILTDERFQNKDIQKFVTMRQNVLHGKINPEKFADLYNEMVATYSNEALRELMAFTDEDEWKHLTGSIEKSLKSAGVPKKKIKEFKDKSSKVDSVDDLSSILNKLFNDHGSDLEYHFMVFTYGGKDHYYIQMDKETFSAMNKIAKKCRENYLDINKVLGAAIMTCDSVMNHDDGSFMESCKIKKDS